MRQIHLDEASGPGRRAAGPAHRKDPLCQRPGQSDGVIFLDQKRAIIDATAPHVVEPDAPGADELVVSLYHTIDAGKLAPHRDEVKALFARNAALRGRAARYIASAAA